MTVASESAALPTIDDGAFCTGAAFTVAADLTFDVQPHLLTASHLLAGAPAIVPASP